MATAFSPGNLNTYSSGITGGTGYPGDADTGHGMRQFASYVDALEPFQTQFLSRLNKGKAIWKSKLEAGVRAQMPHRVTLNEALDASETGIDVATGERLWFTPPQPLLCAAGPGCSASQSAAVTALPGAVFSGSADGGMRAYAARTGEILWTFDANKSFETVNGIEANGGSFDGAGPIVAGG